MISEGNYYLLIAMRLNISLFGKKILNFSLHLTWYIKQFPDRLKVKCEQKSHKN